jgi:hypothetical protein
VSIDVARAMPTAPPSAPTHASRSDSACNIEHAYL